MKSLLMVLCFSLSFLAQAGESFSLKCESQNYTIFLTVQDGKVIAANYAIDGRINTGADVDIEQSYNSSTLLVAQLAVDGQSSSFEVAVVKTESFPTDGAIIIRSIEDQQQAVCSFQ